MSKLGYCTIPTMELAQDSQDAINKIREIVQNGNKLAGLSAAIPLYQIFFSPAVTGKPIEVLVTIREYDWGPFSKAMNAMNPIVRKLVYKTAYERQLFGPAKERNFWRCVSDAAK